MPRFARIALFVLTLSPFLAACEQQPPTPPPAARQISTTQTAATQVSDTELANLRGFVRQGQPKDTMGGPLPAGHPPIGGTPAAMPQMAPATPARSLAYAPPPSWQSEQPRSSMRLDQFRLPRAAGDPEDGELAVFGPNIGGGVQGNLERWRAQFIDADGQPVPDSAVVSEQFTTADGLKVSFIEVAGRYNPGAMSFGGPAPAVKDNYRLLGGIVETPGGLWYFKAAGPSRTMLEHRGAFIEFLKAMKTEAGGGGGPAGHP